jgi:hypothetical protein
MKHYFTNTSDFIHPLMKMIKSIFFKMFYKTVTYKNNDSGNIEYWKSNTIQKMIHMNADKAGEKICGSKWEKNIPLYLEMQDDYTTVYYFRFIHSNLENKIDEQADKLHATYKSSSKKKCVFSKVLPDLRIAPSKPSIMFPSSNYIKLSKCIHNFIQVNNINKSYQPLGILVDGEPGLGKTKFADYMYETEYVHNIVRMDMTTVKHLDFDHIIKNIYSEGHFVKSTMYVIDELDKYLQYRIDTTYYEMKDKYNSDDKKDKKNDKNDKKKMIYTKKEHVHRTKLNFLYSLLSILEKDGLSCPCVIMFCSNNFDSIFEGIDNKHFVSLKKRFMQFRFDRCGRYELIEYLRFYNDKFIDTEFYEKEFHKYANTIKNNINIPYRDLNHITIKKAYNIRRIVKALNKWGKNDLIISPNRNMISEDDYLFEQDKVSIDKEENESYKEDNESDEEHNESYEEYNKSDEEYNESDEEDNESYEEGNKSDEEDNESDEEGNKSNEEDNESYEEGNKSDEEENEEYINKLKEQNTKEKKRNEVIAKLRNMISDVSIAETNDSRVVAIKKIYDFLGSDKYKILHTNSLSNAIVKKYHEFISSYPPAELVLKDSYEKAIANIAYEKAIANIAY